MYNRQKVYEYAQKWAYNRNPQYYNYDNIGGDCTNFSSQCIFAGCNQMNYSKNNGWYYINGNNKSPSWTGVEFLFEFLTSNKKEGPKGTMVSIDKLNIGDIIQLSFDGIKFSHALIVIKNGTDIYNTQVSAHTDDVFGKIVCEYNFIKYRCVHIAEES